MTYIKNIADMRQVNNMKSEGSISSSRKKCGRRISLSNEKSHSAKGSSGILSADVNRHKKGHSLVKRKKEPVHKLLKCVRPEMKKERVGVKTYLKRELAEVFRFANGFIAPTTATDVSHFHSRELTTTTAAKTSVLT